MLSLIRGLLWLACLCIGTCAPAGELVAQAFHSQVLGRDYRYQIYLPEGYANEGRHYPVLYLLHGAGGDENEWTGDGRVRETLDKLIADGEIQPMVVVMPGHPQGWWVDGAKDKAETAFLSELLPHAEGHFRVRGEALQRMVAGTSAGGYGALNLVLKYPQLFQAAALLSPAIYVDLPPSHSSAMLQPPFQKQGTFDPALWRMLNYPAHIDAYKLSRIIVPLYIVSGDHDRYGIALQSAMLFEKLRLHQPDAIALRIVNGDHEWELWREALRGALLFLNARLQSPRPSETVRAMSYNIRCGSCERESDINHWSRRKYLVADVIKNSRTDLIGLQEAELFQVQDLVSLLGDFDWVGVGRDDGREKGEINAVLVRRSAFSIVSQRTLWLSKTPEQVSKGWDAQLNRTVTVVGLKSRASGRSLHFLNTHFDHAGVAARNESATLIEKLVQTMGVGLPVILTGDFNAKSDFTGYRILTMRLRDAATASLAPTTGGNITFNGFGADIQPDNKIDYIFVSPDLEVKTHGVVTDLYDGRYPSDHFPLVTEVLLR